MIFQDNHSTIVMEEDTVRKEFQEDLIVRKPNITIYLLSLQLFYSNPNPPPRVIWEKIIEPCGCKPFP